MADKKDKYPVQVRTFMETIKGKKDKITEKDFNQAELDEIKQAIMSAEYRDKKSVPKKGIKTQPTARKLGEGSVDYKDYTTDRAVADFNFGKSGAVRNTLGRFNYKKTPDGRLIAKDTYDFKDDLVKEAKVRPSADYPKSTVGKIAAVAADTLFPTKGDGGFDYVPNPIKGIQTLPSRIGSAFVGADGRPVEIDLGDSPFKRGGKVKRKLKVKRKPKDGRMKKAKGRDGIAQRGKTRGRMR
jgi:hypothetical protein